MSIIFRVYARNPCSFSFFGKNIWTYLGFCFNEQIYFDELCYFWISVYYSGMNVNVIDKGVVRKYIWGLKLSVLEASEKSLNSKVKNQRKSSAKDAIVAFVDNDNN